MSNVSEQFALLLSDRRPGGTGLLTRYAGVATDLGPVLLGIDMDGRRHLLVPVASTEAPDDRISRGINLSHRELAIGAGVVRFADLSCTIGRLVGPFDQLVDDVLGRLTRDPRSGLNAVVTALDDWRALLRRALDDLSREEVIGLIGELEVMRLLAAEDPVSAVTGWTGPTGAVHDFSRQGRDIEVKSTAAVNATSVRISNLDQLDAALSTKLHLAVVHLAAATDAPDIEARIEALRAAGVPGNALETRLNDAGFFPGMELNDPTRYVLREIRWWKVDPSFPGLRASDIAASRLLGVDRVSYDLLLGVLPPAMPAEGGARVVQEWSA
ncbi:PD-(D/E)XK motif protein [Nocardioides campestrisoli]|uniref:PD-(D/E)XK motif protein n=1 Tax=Nocardioides campestrisoli TaxID=2736757 RepID=UPI0015E75F50|nr:PD-(D/E)XK motif protein [Nocardioides campestrisoli]